MGQEKYFEITEALKELGFTDLEATVYCFLVENSAATPYRVAQEIGKPVANTYKAVQALFQKGVVLIDDTKARQCHALPPGEMLDRLKHSFTERHEKADALLAGLSTSSAAEGVFSLPTPESVFDRCQKMIDTSESIVLIDAYPDVVETLKPWLETAAKRKVKVVLQAYKEVELKGVEVVQYQSAGKMLQRWSGNWLIVVVDGAEYLFAYVSDHGRTVHNAIWCRSSFLALPQHCSLARSIRVCMLEKMLITGATNAEMKRVVKRTEEWLVLGKRGYEELAARFSTGDR